MVFLSIIDHNSMKINLKRTLAFMIDLSLSAGVATIVTFLFELISFNDYNIPFYLVIICILCKDLTFENGSIGKNMLKLKLVQSEENSTVSIIVKLLRNVTCFIWPIEGLILFVTKKRLTDMLFKTQVIG